jgi:cell division protein FtsL
MATSGKGLSRPAGLSQIGPSLAQIGPGGLLRKDQLGTMTHQPAGSDQTGAAMPTPDRSRVIAEEEFRKATAKRLEREMETVSGKWGRILNSPLMIWLLSTVVVSLATWAYQQHAERRRHETEQRELITRTRNELQYRLSACDQINSKSQRNDVENILSSAIGMRPLYEEFRNRNLANVYYLFCSLGTKCQLTPSALAPVAEDIRRTTWSEIVIEKRQTLQDRSMLPKLERACSRLEPVRRATGASPGS